MLSALLMLDRAGYASDAVEISTNDVTEDNGFNPNEDFVFNLPLTGEMARTCLPGDDHAAASCLPPVLSPGVQKCGTSFAYYYLIRHPSIGASKMKEVNYFLSRAYSAGVESYSSNFIDSPDKINIDFSPKYMMLPESAVMIYNTNRATKFVVMLRDPVDRAYSHFQFQRKLYEKNTVQASKCPNRVSDLNFKQYLSEEFSVLNACNMSRWNPESPHWLYSETMPSNCTTWTCFDPADLSSCQSCFQVPQVTVTKSLSLGYMSHGIYVTHIEYYLRFFPIDNFLFVRFEDLEEKGETVVLNEIAEWMGLQSLPEESWGNIQPINQNDYPPMEPDEETFLRQFFEKPNQRLYELIGRDMKWKRPE